MEALLEAAVVAVAAVPPVRLLLKNPVRRELRAHPLLAGAVLAVALLSGAVLLWAALESDAGRRVIVGLIAASALLAFVHARPAFGRSRHLPPGSLGLTTSLEAIDDPDFYSRAASRWGPVFKMRQVHRPVVCITEMPTALAVLRSADGTFAQSDWSFNRLVPGGYLEFMNGAVHAEYRRTFATAFTTEGLQDSLPTITMTVRRQLTAMARSRDSECVDPEPFLLPVPLTSLLEIVLGVRPGGEQFDSLSALFVELNRPMELFLPPPRAKQETWRTLTAAVSELARRAPGSSTTPGGRSVLAHIIRANPSAADDATVIGNLILMVKEGGIMVRGLLRWLLKMLAENEATMQQLRAAAHGSEELDRVAAGVVSETIRLHETRYLYRSVVRTATIGDFRIPRGWLVRLCLGEAHDARRGFCPFGAGAHACLGGDIVTVIGVVFVREAALGYDLRVVRDGAAWRINRHWGLWRPSGQFRIAITERISA